MLFAYSTNLSTKSANTPNMLNHRQRQGVFSAFVFHLSLKITTFANYM